MHPLRKALIPIFLCLGASQGVAEVPPSPPLASIESLDVQRYMGKWYEISHYPNWFQKKKADLLSEAMASEELSVRMALVLQALQTGSQEVRIEALRSLVGVSGQAQLAAYKMALEDDDPIVRDAALQIARDQEPEVRMPTYELALASPHPEVRQQTFVELTREPGKAAFEIYMRHSRCHGQLATRPVLAALCTAVGILA